MEVKELVPDVIISEYEELEFKNYDGEKNIDTLYIKNTRRHFIVLDYNWITIYDFDEEESIVCFDFKAAWSIETDALRTISMLYDIDFKIYAFESGIQFNQDIEIVKGKIVKDDEITFDDYIWECVDPTLGG